MKSLIERRPVLFYSIVALLGCILLNIGIFKDYAFTDDYEFLWSAHTFLHFKDTFIGGGRPLYAELNQFVFGTLIHTISGLKWVRLFSILCCTLLSIQIFSFLIRRIKNEIYETAIFSFLIFSIPSIGVFISWSVTYEIPLALNCSFFAGILLLRVFEKEKYKKLNYIFAVILIIISLCLYQSAGTAFLIPFVFSFSNIKENVLNKLVHLFVFFGISFGLYYILFTLSLGWYGVAPIDRSSIDLMNFPSRFLGFYIHEMKALLYGSTILLQSNIFLFLGLFLFLGFFFLMIKQILKKSQFILMLIFLLLVLPISYLPNLLSVDNWKCSRTIAPAAIIMLFFQFYFLQQLSIKSKVVRFVSLILAVILIIGGAINVNVYFAGIQSKEYSALRSEFNAIANNNTKHIILIRPEYNYLQKSGYYKYAYSDEYGQLSCSRDWVPVPFINQVIKEKMNIVELRKMKNSPLFSNKIEIEMYGHDEFYNNTDSAIVINMGDVLKKEFSKK